VQPARRGATSADSAFAEGLACVRRRQETEWTEKKYGAGEGIPLAESQVHEKASDFGVVSRRFVAFSVAIEPPVVTVPTMTEDRARAEAPRTPAHAPESHRTED
jgi:hypothetical protein